MSDPDYTPGYRLDSDIVRRELHSLLCVFMAIQPIRASSHSERDPISALHWRFAEAEIQRLLITTAIMNRTQMDHMRHLRDNPDELSFPNLNEVCGELRQPGGQPPAPLTIREACNKIVHALKIHVELAAQPHLILAGRQNRQEWMAVVDVVQYVRASYANFEDALA